MTARLFGKHCTLLALQPKPDAIFSLALVPHGGGSPLFFDLYTDSLRGPLQVADSLERCAELIRQVEGDEP